MRNTEDRVGPRRWPNLDLDRLFDQAPQKQAAHRGNGPGPAQMDEDLIPPNEWTNSLGMEFALVPAGKFNMGSSSGAYTREPFMSVQVSNAFYLGKHEVTQQQWVAVMGSNPSEFKDCGPDCPVENVNWDDAQEVIRRLNEAGEGDPYRLPSEAEWEYAAAGTKGGRHGKLGEIAWWQGNSEGRTHPVGQKAENDFGLHDMLGNVREWVADWHWEYRSDGGRYESRSATAPSCPCPEPTRQARVIRGCSWNDRAEDCSSGVRFSGPPSWGYHKSRWDSSFGFRVLREVR